MSTTKLQRRVVRHSASQGAGSPDVWGIYEPDTGSIQYICADPVTKKAALIDVVWNFDLKNYRFSTESMDQVLDLVREHGLEVDWVLDRALVLAVIGSRTQPEHWMPALTELGTMTHGNNSEGRQLPINIQSVADYSGIPRETVRRKVAILQDRGWITRAADGRLAVAQHAAHDLEDATGETIAYLASLLRAFQSCPPSHAPGCRIACRPEASGLPQVTTEP